MIYHLARLAGGDDLSRLTHTLDEQTTDPQGQGKRLAEVRLPAANIPAEQKADIRPTGIKILGKGSIQRVYPGLEGKLSEEEIQKAIAENSALTDGFEVYIGSVDINRTGHMILSAANESAGDILSDTRAATVVMASLAKRHKVPMRAPWRRNIFADLTVAYFQTDLHPDDVAAMETARFTALEIAQEAIDKGFLVRLDALEPFEHGSLQKLPD